MAKLTGKKLLILIGWLLLWQLASWAVGNSVILVGPWETALALAELLGSLSFWQTVCFTFLRISAGFLLAFLAALLSASLAHKLPLLEELLSPLLLAMRSVPVVCFVILALVWVGSGNLTFVIVFVIVFPILYLQTLEGLARADHQLLEMSQVFRLKPWSKVRYVYLPALLPSLISGCKLALGMSWKSGVAAEVIGTPAHSIGQMLYFAKIYLEIDHLFAWTVMILLLSSLFERLFLFLLTSLAHRLEGIDDLQM